MQHLLNIVRGGLIGSAELVPGISGGTVALIVGIYEQALDNGHRLLKGQFGRVDWAFLFAVLAGMGAAVFGLSSLLHGFVDNHHSLSSALFFGMVAVSLFVPLGMIPPEERTRTRNLVVFSVAAVAIFILTGLTREPVEDPSLLVVFGAAALAVCALVLPGVSGSLILLIFGLYEPIIGAVSSRDWGTIGVFALGALAGLALFIELLNWLLHQHRTLTLSAMAGLMLGSLRALWPWGEEQDASLLPILGMIALGGAVVGSIIVVERRLKK